MSFQIVRLPSVHAGDTEAAEIREELAFARLQGFFTRMQAHQLLWGPTYNRRTRAGHVLWCLEATEAELTAYAKKRKVWI